MLDMLFIALFAINVAIAIYLGVNAKSYARPWRMFAVGLLSIFIAYVIEQLPQTLNASANSTTEGISHLAKLTSLICIAMAGALIGAAIANRAAMLHANEMSNLNKLKDAHKAAYADLLTAWKKEMDFKSNDPGDIALNKKKIETIERLIDKAMDAEDKLNDQFSRMTTKS